MLHRYRVARAWPSSFVLPLCFERLLLWLRRACDPHRDLPAADQQLLRRHTLVGWSVALAVLALYAALDYGSELLLTTPTERWLWRVGLLLLLACVAVAFTLRRLHRQTADHFRDRQTTHHSRERAARLEGALLAGQTMQHRLGNQLALTSGYAELLALDPRLPADLCTHANQAVLGVQRAIAVLEQLNQLRHAELEAVTGPALLVLSTSERGPSRNALASEAAPRAGSAATNGH